MSFMLFSAWNFSIIVIFKNFFFLFTYGWVPVFSLCSHSELRVFSVLASHSAQCGQISRQTWTQLVLMPLSLSLYSIQGSYLELYLVWPLERNICIVHVFYNCPEESRVMKHIQCTLGMQVSILFQKESSCCVLCGLQECTVVEADWKIYFQTSLWISAILVGQTQPMTCASIPGRFSGNDSV